MQHDILLSLVSMWYNIQTQKWYVEYKAFTSHNIF